MEAEIRSGLEHGEEGHQAELLKAQTTIDVLRLEVERLTAEASKSAAPAVTATTNDDDGTSAKLQEAEAKLAAYGEENHRLKAEVEELKACQQPLPLDQDEQIQAEEYDADETTPIDDKAALLEKLRNALENKEQELVEIRQEKVGKSCGNVVIICVKANHLTTVHPPSCSSTHPRRMF